nr:hypothetical protein [Dickeya oryzae]
MPVEWPVITFSSPYPQSALPHSPCVHSPTVWDGTITPLSSLSKQQAFAVLTRARFR